MQAAAGEGHGGIIEPGRAPVQPSGDHEIDLDSGKGSPYHSNSVNDLNDY
jgi:hypothetical protein